MEKPEAFQHWNNSSYSCCAADIFLYTHIFLRFGLRSLRGRCRDDFTGAQPNDGGSLRKTPFFPPSTPAGSVAYFMTIYNTSLCVSLFIYNIDVRSKRYITMTSQFEYNMKGEQQISHYYCNILL